MWEVLRWAELSIGHAWGPLRVDDRGKRLHAGGTGQDLHGTEDHTQLHAPRLQAQEPQRVGAHVQELQDVQQLLQ